MKHGEPRLANTYILHLAAQHRYIQPVHTGFVSIHGLCVDSVVSSLVDVCFRALRTIFLSYFFFPVGFILALLPMQAPPNWRRFSLLHPSSSRSLLSSTKPASHITHTSPSPKETFLIERHRTRLPGLSFICYFNTVWFTQNGCVSFPDNEPFGGRAQCSCVKGSSTQPASIIARSAEAQAPCVYTFCSVWGRI